MTTPTITTLDRFEGWLRELDDITRQEMGCSYQDLPDQLFRDWFDDGMTPAEAYHQILENECQDLSIFTQTFDNFSAADPGL